MLGGAKGYLKKKRNYKLERKPIEGGGVKKPMGLFGRKKGCGKRTWGGRGNIQRDKGGGFGIDIIWGKGAPRGGKRTRPSIFTKTKKRTLQGTISWDGRNGLGRRGILGKRKSFSQGVGMTLEGVGHIQKNRGGKKKKEIDSEGDGRSGRRKSI